MQTSKLLASISAYVLFSHSIQAGLVGSWSFNEGSGTNIADSSGNGNNGVIYNIQTNTWISGISGSALYFPGTTGTGGTYVKIPDSTSLHITSAISMAAWVRVDNISRDAPVLDKEGPSIQQSYWFGAYGGTTDGDGGSAAPGDFGILLNRPGNSANNGWSIWARRYGSLPQGNWVHIASTWDGTTIRFYTNGVALPQTVAFSGTLNVSAAFLSIGNNSAFYSAAFQGAIDEVRLYNNALSPAEVAALAVAPNANLSIATAVQVTWPTLTNVNYQPQWASDVQTNIWNNFGNSVLGTGSNTFLVDPLGSNNRRFYRVLVTP